MTAGVGVPAEQVRFQVWDRPNSWFYELIMDFGGRLEETSGSRANGAVIEDDLMRACLLMLAGARSAQVWIEPQPGLTRLTLTARFYEGRDERVCEILWEDVDEATGGVLDSRVLGVAGSIRQMAEAALDLGERAGHETRALTALRGALAATATA